MNDAGFIALTLDRRMLLSALRGLRNGDFSMRLPTDLAGIDAEIADAFNDIADMTGETVREVVRIVEAVARGNLAQTMLDGDGRPARPTPGAWKALIDSVNAMALKNAEQDWLKTNLARFNRLLQGHRDLAAVSTLILSELAPLVNSLQGAIYIHTSGYDKPVRRPHLELIATYASRPGRNLPKALRLGEGLVGQCALERRAIIVDDVPDDFLRIRSSLGSGKPVCIVILPVLFEGEIKAVIELALFRVLAPLCRTFLDQLTESLGIVFNTIEAGMRTENLLSQSQRLTRELQARQEELKESNDRLEQHAVNLQQSQGLLQKQRQDLQQSNEQLAEKASLLSEQMRQVGYKNSEVEIARSALEEKATQLAQSSRYKSEFLANMSHELRTPLNSLLILAKLLAENASHNLTTKQIEYAQSIHGAGNDLLSLINDVLDLAKIESGKITLNIDYEQFSTLRDYVERTFRQVAQNKHLGFRVEIAPDVPATFKTDLKRLQQILKNLLSNAFKFTVEGEVVLRIAMAPSTDLSHERLEAVRDIVIFAVSDTGIGIPQHKQNVIFEAFQQADGTTSREYGGTGLGLSITRELTHLLGGELRVDSMPGVGSTFALFLPLERRTDQSVAWRPSGPAPEPVRPAAPAISARRAPAKPATSRLIRDDVADLDQADRVLLIVDDDPAFATTLLAEVRASGAKGIVAPSAASALVMAKEHLPDAITLELRLPDMDGWEVLDLLKQDPETRHIPVTVISAANDVHKALHMGAYGILKKPAAPKAIRNALSRMRAFSGRERRTVLLADGDEAQRMQVAATLDDPLVAVVEAGTADAAKAALRKGAADCLVLGEVLADRTAVALLQELVEEGMLGQMPVVLYGSGTAAPAELECLQQLAEVAVIKRVCTPAGLLRETTLFLHQKIGSLPADRREVLANLQHTSPELAGTKVLIVDDDIRNIFALTGVLEQHSMVVLNAENGKDGIETLKSNPGIDVVLMDIMMPELDGYDTIRIIRGLAGYGDLPIIAVTARAMQGDREKCIDAGASDYIAKPVNIEQLLSLLRVWLTT